MKGKNAMTHRNLYFGQQKPQGETESGEPAVVVSYAHHFIEDGSVQVARYVHSDGAIKVSITASKLLPSVDAIQRSVSAIVTGVSLSGSWEEAISEAEGELRAESPRAWSVYERVVLGASAKVAA